MTTINKTGGATSYERAGGVQNSPQLSFNSETWLVSLFRALKNYINSNSSDVYEIVGSFPSSDFLGNKMPFRKTIIHFEIDDVENVVFGFGENQVQEEYNLTERTVTLYEARCHIIDFDLGVWASEASGGVTARLNAYQTLSALFDGAAAFDNVRNNVGAEVVSFQNGAFVNDNINDQQVFRIAGMTLRLRVYSKIINGPIETIEAFVPVSGLILQGEVVIDA